MEIEGLNELSLRLLGYYNEENQTMNPEQNNPNLAEALAELLAKTFDGIVNQDKDPAFKSAIENGVFIMRDRESNLYAYFHKEKRARVTDVEFNREGLTILPLEYKNWFEPGEELVIYETGIAKNPRPNQSFYEYLKNIGSVGHQVELSVGFLPKDKTMISGELIAVGKDFIRIKELNAQDVILSDHMLIRIDPTVNVEKVEQKVEVEDPFIPALGVIIRFDEKKGLGYVRRYGDNATLGLRKSELIDPEVLESPIDKKIVFSTRTETHPNGKSMTQALFVHTSGKASKMIQLAEYLAKSKQIDASSEVLQHILNYDPDNEDALLKLEEINSLSNTTIIDEDTIKFKKAVDLLQNKEKNEDNIDKAIGLLESVLNNGKKIKDTITRLAIGYYMRYEQETDEDNKEVYRKQLCDFVRNNHSKLSPAGSINMRLRYYNILGFDEAYLDTIDSILQEPSIGNTKRATMFYYKALYYHNHDDEKKALSFAEESSYLKPFGNSAERILIPGLNELTSPKRSNLITCLLYKKNDKKAGVGADYAQVVERLDKTDLKYSDYLLSLARDLSENNEDKAISYLAEYIAIQANRYADENKLSSAIYYWSELFGKILSGFGYFSMRCFADFLAYILNVDIRIDSSIETHKPWENRKKWDEILKTVSRVSTDQWNQIIYVIGGNKVMRETVCSLIQNDVELMGSFADYVGIQHNELSRNSIISAFDEKINYLFKYDYMAIQEIRKGLKSAKTLDSLCVLLNQISLENDPFRNLESGGKDLLTLLFNDCLPILNQYITNTDAKLRYPFHEELVHSLKAMYKEIWTAPTLFSVEGVWFIMTFIYSKIKIVLPMPELKLRITQENVTKDSYGYYEVRGELSIDENQLDIYNVKLSVRNSKVGFFRYEPHPYYVIDLLKSGDTVSFSFRVKLPTSYKKTNFAFAIRCEYTTNNTKKEKYFTPLQIRLIEPEQEQSFIPIEKNPYTFTEELTMDDPTFVGRKKNIEQLVERVLNPQRDRFQIIVFGQKRCGKTTLVKAVIDKLKREHENEAWCVYKTLTVDGNKVKPFDDRDFYRIILTAIRAELSTCAEPKPELRVPSNEEMRNAESPSQLFCDTIMAFKQSMQTVPGWEHKRLVVILDEFTALYDSIKSGKASENILHNWRSIQGSPLTSFITIFVGHDISKAFLDEPYARNAAGIIEPYQLTYLTKDEAIELINGPTRIGDKSRFEDKAIDKILYYTGCSPFFLQMFMKRMVEYINVKKPVTVTDTDVLFVAQDFISKKYEELSSESKFDSLINCGLTDRYGEYKDKDIVKVLRVIARNSEALQWCEVSKVHAAIHWRSDHISKKSLEGIIKDLDVRKVVEIKKDKKGNRLIKIIVGIFKEWLNRN